jgi:probable blue pigment (indigoidine) exporter
VAQTSLIVRPRELILLVLAAASWGLGTVISKRAVAELPPLTLLSIQLAASLVTLIVLMRSQGLSLTGSPPALARLGILNPGIAYALGLLGLTYISASLAVLLWAFEPLLILLLAAVFLGESVGLVVVGLSALAATGMAAIVLEPSIGGQWLGIVLTLAGVACCAVYTVIARKLVTTSDSTTQVVLAQQAYALAFALVVVVVAAVLGEQIQPATISAFGLLSAVGSGVLYYAVAYWLYLSALRAAPASLASSAFYLIPVFGVAGGSVLLGERLAAQQWVGVLVVIVAVLAIVIRLRPMPTSDGVRQRGRFHAEIRSD